MALSRKPNPDGSLTLHRLELSADLASQLADLAAANERTIPAQVRAALREWLAGQGQPNS